VQTLKLCEVMMKPNLHGIGHSSSFKFIKSLAITSFFALLMLAAYL
jgi:hypothetical protein